MTVIWIASVDGGTALVKRLAEQGNGTPCYEEVAANPFAARDSPSGLHYLCTALLLQDRAFRKAVSVAGCQAQRPVRRKIAPPPVSLEASSRPFVLCDFHPSKSLIEAEYLLPNHEQREAVRSLYRLLRIPEPDLAVYLRAASDVIASRLRRQDMGEVDTAVIERACQAHDAFFRRYKGEKVELDTTSFDYVDDSQALASILKEVPFLYRRSSS